VTIKTNVDRVTTSVQLTADVSTESSSPDSFSS